MWRSARPERRAAVGGMLASLALTSFLTGVTEPIEFSFMFLAPALYALHAVLTGLSMVLMDALKIRLGFSFSAGLFDLLINWNKETNRWLLLPVGLAYAAIYYTTFRFAIVRFDLKTPGREPDDEIAAMAGVAADTPRGRGFIDALGGPANLASVDACTTRLRLVVNDQRAINEPALKALGARGLVRPSPRDLQVVLGPIADEVAREMRDALGGPAPKPGPPPAKPAISAPPADSALAHTVLKALGGAANLRQVEGGANRLLVALGDVSLIDLEALKAAGLRGMARTAPDRAQLIFAADAGPLAEAISGLAA
jgi:PTS system N-acetylglucosamine-specific IIC component